MEKEIMENVGINGFFAKVRTLTGKYKRVVDIAFYVSFSFAYFRFFLNTTMFSIMPVDFSIVEKIYLVVILVMCAVTGISIIETANWKYALLVVFVLGSCVLFYRQSGSTYVFVFFLIVFAAKGKKFDTMLKISLIIGCIMMAAAYAASIEGFIPYLTYGISYSGQLSHAFGIGYRTDFGAHILYLVMAYVVLRREKLSLAEYSLLCFCTWVVWRYSGARLNAACLAVFLSCYAIIRGFIIWRKCPPRIPRWTACIHLICGAVMISAVLLYNGELPDKISGIDTNTLKARLMLSREAFDRYSLSLFGNYVEEQGNGGIGSTGKPYFFLDIAYVRMIVIYGLIITVVYLSFMTFASYKSAKTGQIYILLALAVIAGASMIEHHALESGYNIFLFSMLAINGKTEKELTTGNRESECRDNECERTEKLCV